MAKQSLQQLMTDAGPSEAARITGWDKSTVSKFSRGQAGVRLPALYRAAVAFGPESVNLWETLRRANDAKERVA